jgi:hypothetical protein
MTTAEVLHWAVLLVVLSGVVYRVGRFVVLDTLIEELRWATLNRLASIRTDEGERIVLEEHELGRLPLWRKKLYDLLSCPYCITGWVSAGAVALATVWVPVPLPWFTWLAVWAGGLIIWDIVDSE